jgi:hypothetical protein
MYVTLWPYNYTTVNSVSTLLTTYKALTFGTRQRKRSSSLLKVLTGLQWAHIHTHVKTLLTYYSHSRR